MPRVLRLCAVRTGTELNVSALANDLSIPARTIDGYLTLLEAAFLLHRVPAWSTNLSRKVIRRPKLVVSDSGLACHLLGVTGATLDRPGRPLGPLLETFVANEIRKQLTWSTVRPTCGIFATAAAPRSIWCSNIPMAGSAASRSRRPAPSARSGPADSSNKSRHFGIGGLRRGTLAIDPDGPAIAGDWARQRP